MASEYHFQAYITYGIGRKSDLKHSISPRFNGDAQSIIMRQAVGRSMARHDDLLENAR